MIETCVWCYRPLEEHGEPGISALGKPDDRLCPTADVSSQFWTPRSKWLASLQRKRFVLLMVEGVPVAEKDRYRYALRWVAGDYEPVLYQDGKRVTKRWSLDINIESVADPGGESANTA